MTDRELLEKAAKAAGMPVNAKDGWVWCKNVGPNKRWGLWIGLSKPTMDDLNPRLIPMAWNPLINDGDALRLAVKLMITPHIDGNLTDAEGMNGNFTESHFDDPYAATRRAIVRAAAAIGEAL